MENNKETYTFDAGLRLKNRLNNKTDVIINNFTFYNAELRLLFIKQQVFQFPENTAVERFCLVTDSPAIEAKQDADGKFTFKWLIPELSKKS